MIIVVVTPLLQFNIVDLVYYIVLTINTIIITQTDNICDELHYEFGVVCHLPLYVSGVNNFIIILYKRYTTYFIARHAITS